MYSNAMHYYVVGVNGSGKTSLLKAISVHTGIEVVHGTAELMKYLSIPGDYAALRAMNQDEVLMKWGETAQHLLKEYDSKPFLLDTHILNLTNGTIIRRDGEWIQNYDALVLIKAEPKTILARISQDIAKDRALFPSGLSHEQKLNMLDKYQDETEKLFYELCELYRLPHFIIQNDSTLDDGVATFTNFEAGK